MTNYSNPYWLLQISFPPRNSNQVANSNKTVRYGAAIYELAQIVLGRRTDAMRISEKYQVRLLNMTRNIITLIKMNILPMAKAFRRHSPSTTLFVHIWTGTFHELNILVLHAGMAYCVIINFIFKTFPKEIINRPKE